MMDFRLILFVASLAIGEVVAQNGAGQFKIALPDHKGQLSWSAPGFTIVQSSAKPNGNEIGLRGRDQNSRIYFLGFLFRVSEPAPLTSRACRDNVMGPEKSADKSLKMLSSSEQRRDPGQPTDLVAYTTQNRSGKTSYMVRGFVAIGDICGDLEFYSDEPLSLNDPLMKNTFASYELDGSYTPQYRDILLYAQLLYDSHAYGAAAPLFEAALMKLRAIPDGDVKTMTRVLNDQAGMAYGMSGNIAKARTVFEKAIANDPEYPLYYYNLACADAEEKNLTGARSNLQKAFDRKANILPGESMPNPTKDDSFLPYRNNKDFWAFLQTLQ